MLLLSLLQEVQTAQGQQLQLQGQQQSGSYVVRDDTTVMQQVWHAHVHSMAPVTAWHGCTAAAWNSSHSMTQLTQRAAETRR